MKSLTDRLKEAIPGAITWDTRRASPGQRWSVELDGKVLAHGFTEREAIDRALSLYGSRR